MAEASTQGQEKVFACTVPPHMKKVLPVVPVDPVQHLKFSLAYFCEKSNLLGVQLGVCVHQLQLTTKALQQVENSNRDLSQKLEESQNDIESYKRKLEDAEKFNADLCQQLKLSHEELDGCKSRLEQNDLSREIWEIGLSGNKRSHEESNGVDDLSLIPMEENERGQAFWDRPLTVKRVARENGFKCGKKDLYKLSGHMYNVFVNTRGTPPVIKIVRDDTGIPSSMGFFVERDRGLIMAVLEKFGERERPPPSE